MLIVSVDKGSVGHEVGIRSGDTLLGFNGEPICDILDYIYFDGGSEFVVNIRKKSGELVDFEIEKDEDEPLGLNFSEDAEIEPKRCQNKCVFCFVDQLPRGMRDTLYVKDDDYRLSFISGNYVTLTNVCDEELSRIIKLKLSPLYVSVHALAADVRRRLICNKNAEDLYARLVRLTGNGITVHAQIVLIPEVNGGAVLTETLSKLAALRPNLASVAVVPVGLTKHRDGLAKLLPLTKKEAESAVQIVEEFNAPYEREGGFAWCSDELYMKAERALPRTEYYGDYPQLENGVGLVDEFLTAFRGALERARRSKKRFSASLVTGRSFYKTLVGCLSEIREKFERADLEVVAIENDFFGASVTVAGLITGGDIISQLTAPKENVIIPSAMLREFSDVFLDGVSVSELEKKLGAKVCVARGGDGLVEILEGLGDRR